MIGGQGRVKGRNLREVRGWSEDNQRLGNRVLRKSELVGCTAGAKELERLIKTKGKWCTAVGLRTSVTTGLGP